MDPKANLWREITGIEAELSDPRCPARKTKKARLDKLRRAYRDEHGFPRTSDSTWHPGDEM